MGLIEIKPEFSERESRAVQNVNNAYLAQRIAIGTILAFAGDTIPDGTLLCDGQEVSRTEYAELFEEIGTAYGAGDGVNTFNVPNLKGRMLAGRDATQTEFDTIGETGGHKKLQSHSHSVSGTTSTATLTGWVNNIAVQSSGVGLNASGIVSQQYTAGQTVGYAADSKSMEVGYVDAVDIDATHSHTVTGVTGSSGTGTGENLPPYLTVNYIIIAKSDVSHSDIETALADLITETQNARDNANTAAGEVRSEMAGIKAVDGIVKGDGAGNYDAAVAVDVPITDADGHFVADNVEGALAEAGEHIADTDNPHGVTAAQIGLGDVDNTADADKPVSTAQAVAIAGALDEAKSYTDSVAEDKADKSTTYTKDETDDALLDKADKTALTETNLRIATVDKSLSDYRNAIASINVNQSPKQTAAGYGTVSLLVNAANGQVSCTVGGVTRTNINKRFQDWENGNAGGTLQIISEYKAQITGNGTTNLFMKIYLPAKPSTSYAISGLKSNTASGLYFYFCDANKARLGGQINANNIQTSPSNTALIELVCNTFKLSGAMTFENILVEESTFYGNFITGTKSTISAGRLVSESEDETEKTYQYYPDCGLLRSVGNANDEVSFNQQTGQWEHIKRNGVKTNVASDTVIDYADMAAGGEFIAYYADGTTQSGVKGDTLTALAVKLTYQLAEPIATPVNVTGTLVGHPNGTIYWEPVIPVAGVYTASGIEVTDTDYAIDTLERIAKIDFMTGVETEVDVSQAVIAGDGLSFTHAELADGDIVFFTYYHGIEGTEPEITAEYYDSRYTEEDSAVPGKFYKISYKVTNGVVTPIATEV